MRLIAHRANCIGSAAEGVDKVAAAIAEGDCGQAQLILLGASVLDQIGVVAENVDLLAQIAVLVAKLNVVGLQHARQVIIGAGGHLGDAFGESGHGPIERVGRCPGLVCGVTKFLQCIRRQANLVGDIADIRDFLDRVPDAIQRKADADRSKGSGHAARDAGNLRT
ncbi:hypothetical protein [Mesorhizobium sp. B2-1-3]|uniref:hypothetical protein n=1 Tax=Mesorhizobium sp. B2-1-3 TaxID=2589972 RepID=UPI00112D4201|nr:hypothetical protein [Mesorhizobium sp. B2-1-3]